MKKEYAIRLKLILVAVITVIFCGSVYAKNLDTEITVLSGKLSKKMVSRGIKKVASIDFVDLQGRTTELGRYLAEQLSTEMVNEDGISVVDRANFKSILAEHKLTQAGLVAPENAKRLGKFAGIDAILTGTITTLNGNVVLTVKAISTETAQIVAAAKAVFKNTSELQQLSTRSAASAPDASASKTPAQKSATTTTEPEAPAISEPIEKPMQKAGPLVVTVDSVRNTKRGVRVFFSIDSTVDSSLEVVKGTLIDSDGNEIQIPHSMRTDLKTGIKNQLMVEAGAGNSWDPKPTNLKPPFDLSIDFGLGYGTIGAQSFSVSFHGLK